MPRWPTPMYASTGRSNRRFPASGEQQSQHLQQRIAAAKHSVARHSASTSPASACRWGMRDMGRGLKKRKERIADPFQGGPRIGTAAAQGRAATRTQGVCSRGRIGNPSAARAREVRCGYRMAGGHWGPPADRRSGVGCVCLRRRAATFPSCRTRGHRRGPAQPRSLFELFPFIVCVTKRARP